MATVEERLQRQLAQVELNEKRSREAANRFKAQASDLRKRLKGKAGPEPEPTSEPEAEPVVEPEAPVDPSA